MKSKLLVKRTQNNTKSNDSLRLSSMLFFLTGLLLFTAVQARSASGDLDPTFGHGGTVISETGASEGASEVVIQPDGKIVVLLKNSVARYLPDGSLEQIFGYTSDSYKDIAVQPDGKILTVGNRYSSVGCGAYLITVRRFNRDGTPDTGFGTGGYFSYKPGCALSGYRAYSSAMALQNNGKIVIAGHTKWGGYYKFLALRLNTEGTLDTSFNQDGIGIYPIGSYNDYAYAVAVHSGTGNIIIAGYSEASPEDNWNYYDQALVMLGSNGLYNLGFGNYGKQTTDFSSCDTLTSVAFQTDGKVVVGGSSAGGSCVPGQDSKGSTLTRYNANGQLDSTFSDDGRIYIPFHSWTYISDLTIQEDGKIVATADVNASAAFEVYRFNTDGTFDSTFSDNGVHTIWVNGRSTSLALQPDGKIVVAGYISENGETDVMLTRHLP